MGKIRLALLGRTILGFACAWTPLAILHAQMLPNTEMGNVILRALDEYNFVGYDLYTGHTGVFGGWNGNDSLDPADFFEFDLQPIGDYEVKIEISR